MKEAGRASKKAVVCYGLGEFASQLIWMFVSSYLVIFYTDVVGLAPFVISVIMIGAKIIDIGNDLLVGWLSERCRSKWGRFRPWFAFGAPFLALAGILNFVNPFHGAIPGSVVWAAVTYIITGMLFSVVNIPYGAMAGVMSEDAGQCMALNSCRTIGMQLGMLTVNGLTAMLALHFSKGSAETADAQGYMLTAIVYSVFCIIFFMIVFVTSKEVVQPKKNEKSLSKGLFTNNFIHNKYLVLITLIMIIVMAAVMGRMSVVMYYVIYCMGSYKLIGLITVIPSVCAILISFIVPRLSNRFGKRNVLIISNILMGSGLLFIYFSSYNNLSAIIIGDIIFGMNMGFAVSLTMLADAVDYMELKTSVRSDGTAYAIYGLATKIGGAAGISAGVMLLSLFGYVPNQIQTPTALHGINIVTNLIPAILLLVSAVLCTFWDMSDAEADFIRKQLHA